MTTYHFHGGLKLDRHKDESTTTAVRKAAIPAELVLPLQQHIGTPAEVLVKPGDRVLKGQLLAKAADYVSAPVHAPTSGTITVIENRQVPHPSGLEAPCIIMHSDGNDTWTGLTPVTDFRSLDPSALRNRIREAGIVGLGGAGFPTYIKLNPGPAGAIDTLVINAAECEPYITCDDMLIREHADDILQGIDIMQHALQARHCIIGIEDDMQAAHDVLRKAIDDSDLNIELVRIPSIYPTGGEKQLIRVLTGKEVPSNGLPLDIGLTCHNIGTAAAVKHAILDGKPLISRLVTVTGCVNEPCNFEVLIGTPTQQLLSEAGGLDKDNCQLILGGPMMGFELLDNNLPVIKTSNCILALPRPQQAAQVMPCIRCGACAEVCPAQLLPQQLYWYAHADNFDKIQDYHLFECIECGCCSHVCPSHIPLVQYYRYAKTEIWAMEREKEAADLARQRHEFRDLRLERMKKEKEERLAKKKAALKKPASDTKIDPKKAAIEAALKRVRDKQEKTGVAPKNTTDLNPEQQARIAEADERRKQMKQDKSGKSKETS